MTPISFMCRAIPEKNAFFYYERSFILLMRREENKINIFKNTEKRIIKGLPMQARVWGHISSKWGKGDVYE